MDNVAITQRRKHYKGITSFFKLFKKEQDLSS